ncbi:SCAN domain-containing protein 3 [Nephila pilipes]|uniref:SCAN domain-containing protein 3 n=1 Tax=Nephila pilipes TaxID=299642 RepID=A0A8X6TY44_NEPPI|nr:SCAN domain-containing protein 3 [Nephila pilipes]
MNSDLNYFQTSKNNFEKKSNMKISFIAHNRTVNRTLEASYHISLFIAKSGKSHTIEDNLIKPLISVFLKIILGKDDKDVKDMPLSNSTVSRIDEMSENIEMQFVEKLKQENFGTVG